MQQPSSPAPLEVRQVSKSYGGKNVLDSISLALEPGEIFGLIGLNGIGKTTLIKAILDLHQADGGECFLFGISSREVVSRRRLSYLPEKFQPSRYLKGREYLSLALSFYGVTYDHAKAEAEAESLDLAPMALSKRVGSYSKGMGQKLGLLGAFMSEAPLLILDEPMSGLDPRARILLKRKMLAARDGGRTLFFSSHILADIDEICGRIGVLHDRTLRFLGPPHAFREKHKNLPLEAAFLEEIGIEARAA